MSQLYETFIKDGKKQLAKDLGLKNIMAAPVLKKVVINVSLGEALENKKVAETVVNQLKEISGQKPMLTRAKRDISAFKVRKGDIIGVMVTMRGRRMFDFIEKLVKIVLPRIRDFRGIPNSGFDRSGNYTLGISEQIVFPEIDYSSVDKVRGLEITLVTNHSPEGTRKLMEFLEFPFEGRKKGQKNG